jgi:hypothetical protein
MLPPAWKDYGKPLNAWDRIISVKAGIRTKYTQITYAHSYSYTNLLPGLFKQKFPNIENQEKTE